MNTKIISNKKFVTSCLAFVFSFMLLLLVFTSATVIKSYAAEGDIYTITYNIDGDISKIAPLTKDYNVPINITDIIPEKEGYEFVSWNTSADGSGYSYNPSSEFIRNESYTFYAIWRKVASTNSTTAVLMHYGKNSTTSVPEFELEPVNYQDKNAENTQINTYHWEFWEYENGAYKKVEYTADVPENSYAVNIDTSTNTATVSGASETAFNLPFEPQNKKGLKEDLLYNGTKIGYTTRSGYGFTANGYVNIDKAITSGTGEVSGTLRASMSFPEKNYAKYYAINNGDFNDMIVASVNNGEASASNGTLTYAYYLRESILDDGTTDTENIHYTPMWFPNSTDTKHYSPNTYITGLWTPVGEVRYVIKQEYDRNLESILKLNTYSIRGSLFDDMYTTHKEYRDAT